MSSDEIPGIKTFNLRFLTLKPTLTFLDLGPEDKIFELKSLKLSL